MFWLTLVFAISARNKGTGWGRLIIIKPRAFTACAFMSRAIHLMLHCLNAYEFKFLARIFSDLASYMVIHTVCWRVYIRSNISPEFSHCSAFTLTKLNFYSCSIYPALVHASTLKSLQPPMLKTHHVKNISIVRKAKPIYWPPNYMYRY